MPEPIEFPSSSVRHALPLLFSGQSQKEFFVNEALVRIDSLLHPSIIDERADPPESPNDGDSYLIGNSATGEWAENDGKVAVWQGDQWIYVAPIEGMALKDVSTGQLLFSQGAWQRPPDVAPASGGATIDTEARAAIESLISALQDYGILRSN